MESVGNYHYVVHTGSPLIVPPYIIFDDQMIPLTPDELISKLKSLEDALDQEGHFVTFDEDGWSIEHLVECRPHMTKCEFHQRMMSVAFNHRDKRGRYKVTIKPLNDLEFTRMPGDEGIVYTDSEQIIKGGFEMAVAVEAGSVKEVTTQMNELDGAIESLATTLDELEPKLEKVVRTRTTTDEDKAKEPQEGLCSLAHEIRSFRYRIEKMSASVRDTFSRLEL